MGMTMKTIPEGMRPYERLERCGAEALSDAELLAVLIKSGTREKSALVVAEELLLKHGSLADIGSSEQQRNRTCESNSDSGGGRSGKTNRFWTAQGEDQDHRPRISERNADVGYEETAAGSFSGIVF